MRPPALLFVTLAAAYALSATAAVASVSRPYDPAAPRATRGVARATLVRYFDAIRDDDHAIACRIYRIPGCAGRKPFGLDAYEIGTFGHLTPPAEGDWGAVIYLYAPRRSDGTRDVVVALAVVTCRPACRVTGFWNTAT
jgi:hypothetical protein